MKSLSRDRNHRYLNAREVALALDRAAAPLMWEAEKRATFIQKHFADRQLQIQRLLGDPSSTDMGDLSDSDGATDPNARPLSVGRDLLKTVSVRRAPPEPVETSSATMALDAPSRTGSFAF